jgi:hypothetical protein
MILYHGSFVVVNQPDLVHSRKNVDFGKGFYVTPIFEQAEKWCNRFKRRGKEGVVSRYTFDEEACKDLNVLKFDAYSEEWLDFIISCRKGQAHQYDIVEGPMADDTIYNYLQNYLDGKISRAAFWELVKFKYPTHQISFHTISALDTLKFVGSEVVYGEKK